ncbi:MAG: peptide ABC transporter substrate-binding protein [Actinobacteria bacterium]|nr:peptide ABC transporter substrate-binding protein [Actinomycetota bacterium]MCL6087542.1 peptide ABC transporter substrate-binding protein [Actinomycetota bacterium]
MQNKKALFLLIAFIVISSLVVTLFTGCKPAGQTTTSGAETTAAETTAGETTAAEESTTTAAGQPKTGGIMRLHINEPVSLDPPNAYESEGIQIVRQIWDGLFTYDPQTLETKPKLCEKYEVSDDGLTYTFYIKKGVKFHSGKELKAEDFVYSWTRLALKDTASYLAYHLSPVVGYDECQDGTATELKGMKALDDYSFQVILKYPYSDFINTLGHVAFYPVNKESIEKAGDKAGEMPDGTGPFKFVKWEHDQYVDLVRNDDYYGQKTYLDGAKYVIIPDEQTAFLEFQAGNLEYTEIPVGQVKATQADPKWKDGVIVHPMLGLYYYGMNLNAEPFKDNLALREAINYMIDRQNICEIISEGVSTPATGFVPPGIPGFQENAMEFTFDLEKAKAKLAEAGYPEGKDLPVLNLGYNTGAGHEKIAEAIQADAAKIGIKIEVEGFEWGTMLEKAKAGEIIFYRLGWLADYPTMDNFLYPLFYSKSSDNYSEYNNPEVDKLLIEARSTVDKDQRIAKYREVEKMILKDAAFAPIYFYGTRRIIQPYVKDFILDNMENYNLAPVWLDK